MTTIAPHSDTQQPAANSLRGRLGPVAITFMVIAAAAPLTVIGGLVPVGVLVGNGIGFPFMFIVAAVILLLFSVGLVALNKHVPGTGTFSSYVAVGLGQRAGAAAAGLALICYSGVQAAVFAYLGATLSSSVAALGGPTIHWTIYTLASVAIVGILGYRHIELSSKVLFIVLAAEIGIVLVLGVAVIATGGAEGLDGSPFLLSNILSGSPALGLMFALAGFIGFESTVVYRSEARDPERTIPKATYGSAILVGVFYAFGAWVMIMASGPSNIVAEAEQDPAGLLAILTGRYLGPIGEIVVAVLFLGSMFAAVLSLHNVIARYQHSLAHRGLAPRALGAVHAKHGSPHRSAIVQVLTAAALILIANGAGLTAEQLFSWGAGIGSGAIAVLMAATCVSVIFAFRRTPGSTNLWQRLIAPALGAIGLLVGAILIVVNFPVLVGDALPDGTPTWGPVSITLIAIVAAAPIVAWILSYTRPLPAERGISA